MTESLQTMSYKELRERVQDLGLSTTDEEGKMLNKDSLLELLLSMGGDLDHQSQSDDSDAPLDSHESEGAENSDVICGEQELQHYRILETVKYYTIGASYTLAQGSIVSAKTHNLSLIPDSAKEACKPYSAQLDGYGKPVMRYGKSSAVKQEDVILDKALVVPVDAERDESQD